MGEPRETESAAVSTARGGITRRAFLKLCLGAVASVGALAAGSRLLSSAPSAGAANPAREPEWARRARYWRKLANRAVQCQLCPRQCTTSPGGRGHCQVRENRDGDLYTLVYGRAASVNIDPIEKKPFFHVLPGSLVFSFATAGCNIDCNNCQNWQLSQARPEDLPAANLPPADLVAAARRENTPLIAGTYNEPTVFTEYLLDVAREGKKHGVRTVTVSNGFIAKQPMLDLCRELAAVKVDLKSMRESFYRTNCNGELRPVLDTIELVKKQGMWLEIVYLVVPTLNDSEAEIKDLARWMRTHVGVDTPLHFSRFYPQYRLKNLPPTPYETLDRCYQIARAEGLHYVYVGNIPAHKAENTYCPKCKKAIIKREGFRIVDNQIQQGECKFCHQRIPGIWV